MNLTRREFASACASAVALGAVGESASAPASSEIRKDGGLAWSMYQQLGTHMWNSFVKFPCAENGHFCGESTPIDDESWERRMAATKRNGCNRLVVDLAEGLCYRSHPELALKGSRSAEWMNSRVRRLRDMGIEAIPSLNFSAAHNFWMGHWSRRVSTPEYYKFVADLLAEVYDVFEKPSHLNFGMDEENEDNTRRACFCLRRQGDLLWHDIDFYARTVARLGARPWMWSDYEWWSCDVYPKRVSKDILQTNWYYGFNFDYKNLTGPARTYVESYVRLEKAGFDQMPGCSNWLSADHKKTGRKVNTENIIGTVEFCRQVISREHLKGFCCMPWVSTTSATDAKWIDASDQFGRARRQYLAEISKDK